MWHTEHVSNWPPLSESPPIQLSYERRPGCSYVHSQWPHWTRGWVMRTEARSHSPPRHMIAHWATVDPRRGHVIHLIWWGWLSKDPETVRCVWMDKVTHWIPVVMLFETAFVQWKCVAPAGIVKCVSFLSSENTKMPKCASGIHSSFINSIHTAFNDFLWTQQYY